MKVVGIDLAGLEKNPTGFCVLTEEGSEVKVLYTDRQILDMIEIIRPDLIAIDAPFSFPATGYFREGDIMLREAGFRPLSPMFPGMRPLVNRAINLVEVLRERNYKVIEVFPQASEKILGLLKKEDSNPHEYDSLLCAVTGKYFLEGRFRALGKEEIIIPVI